MANRFGRLNLIFDLENEITLKRRERDEREREDNVFETPESSDDHSLSNSSSGSSVERENRKRRRRKKKDGYSLTRNSPQKRDFKVYGNPFDRNRHKKRKKSDGKRKNDNGRSQQAISFAGHGTPTNFNVISSTTTTVNPTVSGNSNNNNNNGAAPNNGRNSLMTDEWNPCSISEDVVVFNKYGVDPKYSNDDGKGCYGCNVQSDNIPVKQSNMKVLLEKIAQSGKNTGNALGRAENIRSNYVDLIVAPKRKLQRLLNDSERNESDTEGEETNHRRHHQHDDGDDDGDDDDDDDDDGGESCEHSFCSHERPSKSRKMMAGSSTRDLIGRGSETDERRDICDNVDEWDTLKIYNHLRHHQMNVIDQVQYRRARLWDMMEEMERNSLFVEHGTKKNAFGERLKRADPDQFKVYSDALKNWLLLSKSRPDLMRPFYDPDKLSNQGLSNNKEAEGEIINVSGQLLFGKKKR